MFALLLLLTSPFDACEQELREAEHPSDAYMCFYFTAQEHRAWSEGEDRVATLAESSPDARGWLELVLGHLRVRHSNVLGEASYRAAASEFARHGEAEGEVLARNNLTRLLESAGRIDEAWEQVELVRNVAERSGDPTLIVRARISEGDHLASNGRDLSRAYRSLKRAERFAFPDGSRGLQRRCLGALGEVTIRMGRVDEAIATFERLLAILEEDGDVSAAAVVTFNIANAHLNRLENLPNARNRDDTLALARRTLTLSALSDNARAEVVARRLLAAILPRSPENEGEARAHLDRCVALATELDNAERRIDCLWTRAEVIADADPKGAERAINEAIALAGELDLTRFIAHTARSRATVSWKTKSFERAVSDSFAALDTIESLRRLQEAESGRAELFSDWSQDYYTLSGRLLEAGDVERGFDVIERMRSRVLLDSLETSFASTDVPASDARKKVLDELAQVQRRLLDPKVTGDERDLLLAELEQLEWDDAELRRARLASPVDETEFASLGDVRDALADDEALLSFQVSLWQNAYEDFGGGSWLLLITKRGAQVFPIPDRVTLEPIVPVFLGLVARGDGHEEAPATKLYDDLLADALSTLSPDTSKLIVIPDGPLHHLPLGALRQSDAPLASRFEITVVPSATIWRRWRDDDAQQAGVAEVPALAFADPALGGPGERAERATERSIVFREGLTLSSLPFARREGRAVVRHLRGASELLLGDTASEHAVKTAELSRYGVLHFAAHAITDAEQPERSAVVLSAGADNEDGLLQVREIDELGLSGQLVVLSACRTASGRLLSGEGVLSLARAFLRAGADTVVASRWPLRDDDAAQLFDHFYRALATGASVSASLRAAKEEAMDAGIPASSWSSLIVYGDGAATPVEAVPTRRAWQLTWLVPIVILLIVVLVGVSRR